MGLTVTDLQTSFGSHYKEGTLGAADIRKRFTQKTVTDMVFNMRTTVNTKEDMVESFMTRVLQLFQKANTPIGGLDFKPYSVNLTPLKVDSELSPDDLVKTAAGFMAKLDDNDRKKWPIVGYYIMHLIEKAQEDWELYEVYKGTQNTIDSEGTANAAGKNFVGLKKQINDAITAGTLSSPIATGAFSTDPVTFVEQMEEWHRLVKEISPEARALFEGGEITEVCVSSTLRDRFKQGMRKKYNMNYEQVTLNPLRNVDNSVTLIDSNIKIIGLPSMTGSEKIFAIPNGNKYGFIKRPNSETTFKVERGTNVRDVFVYADFWKAVGFWIPRLVFTNDQDL